MLFYFFIFLLHLLICFVVLLERPVVPAARRGPHPSGRACTRPGGALARLGDERPLEMHAEDAAGRLAVRRISGCLRPAESLVELIKGRRDDGRLQAGDPTGGQSGEHLLPLLGSGIGEVGTEGPVVLQVHQPRCQHAGPEVDVRGSVVGDGCDPITVDRQRRGSDQAAVLEHLGASDRGHGPSTPLLSRICRPTVPPVAALIQRGEGQSTGRSPANNSRADPRGYRLRSRSTFGGRFGRFTQPIRLPLPLSGPNDWR